MISNPQALRVRKQHVYSAEARPLPGSIHCIYNYIYICCIRPSALFAGRTDARCFDVPDPDPQSPSLQVGMFGCSGRRRTVLGPKRGH